MLSPEDVAVLNDKRLSLGCAVVLGAIFLVIGLVIPLFLHFTIVFYAGYLALAGLIVGAYLLLRWWTNGKIDRDLVKGQKRVLVAPIADKQIDAREITNNYSWRRGEIDSKYRMKVADLNLKMSEKDYLEIRKGEFVEIQIAPISGTIFSKKWLRSDDTSRNLT